MLEPSLPFIRDPIKDVVDTMPYLNLRRIVVIEESTESQGF